MAALYWSDKFLLPGRDIFSRPAILDKLTKPN
jgi:hypothetical protein